MPGGRVARLQELGWAATYLYSPFAAHVSGHDSVIDGANWHRRNGFSMPPCVPVADLLAEQSAPRGTDSAGEATR